MIKNSTKLKSWFQNGYKTPHQVQQKLKTDTYEDIEELSADIELLVKNAKAFYKHDTPEYKDAVELWNLYTKTKQALESGIYIFY